MMKQSLESRDRIFSYKTLINNDNIYTIKSFFLSLLIFFIDYVEVFILFYILIDFIFSKKFVVVSGLIFLIKAFMMEWSLVWGSTTKKYAKYSINTC